MSVSKSVPRNPPLPQRMKLADQVCDILRDGIVQGLWSEFLPGEIELSSRLQVSRMTLRAALEVLAREEWVTSSRGRRRRILWRRTKRRAPRLNKRIVIVTAVPLDRMRSLHLVHVDGLRERLASAGFELDVHVGPVCFSPRPESALEKLVREKPATTWILMKSTARLQRWFMERRHPCVIVGARHPGVVLPSIGTDYHALGFHAAGQFLRRHHRRLAVLLPGEETAGDTNTVAGFRDACARYESAEMRIVRHDGTPAGMRRCLRTLLRGSVPTGVLVALPQFALGALTTLSVLGSRVGKDISLIGRDSDPFLEFVTPSLARYAIDVSLFVKEMSRLTLATARGGGVATNDVLLLPEFLDGETLGTCRQPAMGPGG